jgi:pyruvate,orthophosphate dikinase
MLGLRGVRLLTVHPEIVDVQVRALAEATARLRARGCSVHPEVMIPLVADVAELTAARARVEKIVAGVAGAHGIELRLPIGVMIELPRAALTAADLAAHAEFFSFGTNDLTQTCWGISRDDAEANFLAAYREAGILTTDPFKTLDEPGVGALVAMAARDGRRVRPTLGLGACGEHAGDPASIGFFTRVGVDYLSCSPPRVPVVRLEAGRHAVLLAGSKPTSDTR